MHGRRRESPCPAANFLRSPLMRRSSSPSCDCVDQRDQAIADFEAERIDRHARRPRTSFGRLGARRLRRRRRFRLRACTALRRSSASAPMHRGEHRNATCGMPGIRPRMPITMADDESTCGWPTSCSSSCWPMSWSRRDAADHDARRGRDDQRRDLRHQAVADGEQRVVLGRRARRPDRAGARRSPARRRC